MQRKNWEATFFAAARKLTANIVTDSVGKSYFTSFNTSGLHRTKSELEDRKKVTQWSYGGNLAYKTPNFKVGVNAVQHFFSKPLYKRQALYNLYAIGGEGWANGSIDYAYTYKNVYLFGEAATDQKGAKAFIQGLLASVDPKVDMALLYRNISQAYQALYGNAFTENALPANEKGLYAGIAIRPHPAWRLQAYADYYQFPWLRYRVDAPGTGKDHLVQVQFTPNKVWEAYLRYRSETKPLNSREEGMITNAVLPVHRQIIRGQLAYKKSVQWTYRSRIEAVWYQQQRSVAEKGLLVYAEGTYKPLQKLAANARLQYFTTDGFNSRIYAYESDALYSYSIPFFYGKGFRYYFNLSYDVSGQLTLWLRLAETVYKNVETIGSALEQISGNRRTELKLQLRWVF